MAQVDWEGTTIIVARLHPYHKGEFQTRVGERFELGTNAVVREPRRSELIRLWEALPHAEQARCHEPVYGIGAASGTTEVFRAALCFECNNISIWTPAGFEWREFDSCSPSADALLAMIKQLLASAPAA